MKSSHLFRDQITTVTEWFSGWNECEQSVALYSLLKKANRCQSKFLFHVLDQSILDSSDTNNSEQQANSSSFISKLNNESIDIVVDKLLECLPLLRPGNENTKAEYLKLIPKILQHSVEHGQHIEESRQLLSYSLIHPALNSEERTQLTLWLGHLDEQDKQADRLPVSSTQTTNYATNYELQYFSNGATNLTSDTSDSDFLLNGGHMIKWNTGGAGSRDSGISTDLPTSAGYNLGGALCNGSHGNHVMMAESSRHAPLISTLSAPPELTKPPIPISSDCLVRSNGHSQLKRTSSVVPPSNLPSRTVSDWLGAPQGSMPGNEHAPVSPQSSCASSGSGSDHHDDIPGSAPCPTPAIKNIFLEESSGMKDIPIWLKALRLHKYAYVFQQMTYEEMLSITEESLEQQNITKGARHKIVLSVQKLKDRQDAVKQLEKEIVEGGNFMSTLRDLKQMVHTPMKRWTCKTETSGGPNEDQSTSNQADEIAEGDLPGQMIRLMGKVCTQLLVASRLDDDAAISFVHLIDKCNHHEAFSEKQKKLLISWKQQIQKIWNRLPLPRYNTADKNSKKGWVNTFPLGGTAGPIGRPRLQRPSNTSTPQGHRPLQPTWSFGSNRSMVSTNNSMPSPNQINTCNTYLQPPETTKQVLHRTHSAPIRSNPGLSLTHRPASDLTATEPEINARLDSLCLSMTEAALGTDGPGNTF